MNKLFYFLGAIFISFLSVFSAKADGGVFPPPNHYIFENEQKAVIVFDQNVETLIISTSYKGDAKDFAWVIPTPNQPQVDKAKSEIFASLQKLTGYSNRGDIPIPMIGGAEAPQKLESVSVLEEKTVDIYDIAVLSATDKNSLYDWLNKNGYVYPDSGKQVLNYYIQKSWYFTAAKVNNQEISSQTTEALNEGTANPLKLVFETDKIVYPMKMSSVVNEVDQSKILKIEDSNQISQIAQDILDKKTYSDSLASKYPLSIPEEKYKTLVSNENNASSSVNQTSQVSRKGEVTSMVSGYILSPVNPLQNVVGIQIYIFANHRKDIAGFETEWANWVNKAEIQKLATDDNGNPWFSPSESKLFLTSLQRSMKPSEAMIS